MITFNDILQLKPAIVEGRKTAKVIHNGRELTQPEIAGLKAEAELMQKTKLWNFLIVEGKYHAQKRAVVDVKTLKELQQVQEFHKAVVLFEEFIDTISKL